MIKNLPFVFLAVLFVGWHVEFVSGQTGADQAVANDETAAQQTTKDVHKLRPQFPTEVLIEKSEAAIQAGLEYLVKSQNADGSWGSHDPQIANLANFGFQLRNRGSQDAVRIACTAICAEAFLNQEKLTDSQQAAFDKAVQVLIQAPEIDPETGKRPAEFAFHPGETFNTWGYGYKLGFLTRLHDEPAGKPFQDEIELAAQCCVDSLLKHQQHNGGWHYYGNQIKGQGSMSFNTSFFALSLQRADGMGIKVPEGMVPDAVKVVDRQRVPDGSFHYDSRFFNSGSSALANLGSGSRTISNTVALYQMGFYSQKDLLAGLEVFDNGENYLEMGRKRITPHSVVHQISGYFFFFGYNYATEAAEILGEAVPQSRWDRFGWTMIRTQENDGRWWDTAAAEYGDKWGTGFALQTLQRYVRETKRRSLEAAPTETSPTETSPAKTSPAESSQTETSPTETSPETEKADQGKIEKVKL